MTIIGKDCSSFELGRPSRSDSVTDLLSRVIDINPRSTSHLLLLEIVVFALVNIAFFISIVRSDRIVVYIVLQITVAAAFVSFFDFHLHRYRRIYSRICALRTLRMLRAHKTAVRPGNTRPAWDVWY
jgi:hypothetical protein